MKYSITFYFNHSVPVDTVVYLDTNSLFSSWFSKKGLKYFSQINFNVLFLHCLEIYFGGVHKH